MESGIIVIIITRGNSMGMPFIFIELYKHFLPNRRDTSRNKIKLKLSIDDFERHDLILLPYP